MFTYFMCTVTGAPTASPSTAPSSASPSAQRSASQLAAIVSQMFSRPFTELCTQDDLIHLPRLAEDTVRSTASLCGASRMTFDPDSLVNTADRMSPLVACAYRKILAQVLTMSEEHLLSFVQGPLSQTGEICMAISDLNSTVSLQSILQSTLGGLNLGGPLPFDASAASSALVKGFKFLKNRVSTAIRDTESIGIQLDQVANFSLPPGFGTLAINSVEVEVADPFKSSRSLTTASMRASWQLPNFFVATVGLAGSSDGVYTIQLTLDITTCGNVICQIMRDLLGGDQLGATGVLSGITIPSLSSSRGSTVSGRPSGGKSLADKMAPLVGETPTGMYQALVRSATAHGSCADSSFCTPAELKAFATQRGSSLSGGERCYAQAFAGVSSARTSANNLASAMSWNGAALLSQLKTAAVQWGACPNEASCSDNHLQQFIRNHGNALTGNLAGYAKAFQIPDLTYSDLLDFELTIQLPDVTPTAAPTLRPTAAPTLDPTPIPSLPPTHSPTLEPTRNPTTAAPSLPPTALDRLVTLFMQFALPLLYL